MNTILQRRVAVPQLDPGRWLLAVPVVLYALAVLPFVFHDVVGEPDLERTVMAILYGASSGLHEAAGYHYGLEVSFGYYAAIYHLLPRSVLLDSTALIAAINFIGYGSAVVAMGMLALYVARLFGVAAAVVTCVLFGFSPVFLDLGTSGHPQVPGIALTLLGAWLLTYATDIELRPGRRLLAGVAAFAALTVALTMRGDFVLAFPFITLVAGDRELTSRRAWLQAAGQRLTVLIPAFAVFLILQSYSFSSGPGGKAGFVATFFATFYKADTVPRGLIVVVLCSGVATMLAFLWLACVRAARALPLINSVAVLALALPSLAFWLPNSTPGRHLILVTLAVALTIALILTRAARPQWAIPAAALLVISNQAIAEVSHNTLEQHYQWTFPLLTGRRATQSVPMGAFPLDHDAKQELFMLLRNEGRAFARTCSGNVLAFAEEPHYMMLSLVELDRSIRIRSVDVGDSKVIQVRGARCSVDFVEKAAAWHRDALREFLEAGYDAQWPIYFQESRRNPSDRTTVPEERQYCVEKAADGQCAIPAPPG
ncbi:MAG TPA: hypothetical protein VH209_01310 [Steroidobacteraceae bacterium]|nr:hypothetical protein [Steroidobacteraceae bacterium]